ncbi:UDP-glucose dehydrogenase family protein [Raoultibacter phocaeensis]|uniref:UDP-glucose dehydrogenase family protein n=1 Tax=Raoultibacter phocaeensis TaxID=2479841 RepID=UPI00111A8B05|nr:UDP-glucose/GDP-mannose dehydrogenase family protein [Raoultibacter phocaeensis]
MNITVCGTGYVGLVAAVVFASKGHTVVGLDIDDRKVALLKRGVSPLFEPGLEELMAESTGNLAFTTDYREAYAHAEAIFVAVPTPEKEDGSAELSYVMQACNQIVESRGEGCFVVIKSTVPPGTNDRIQAYFDELTGMQGNARFEVVSNPEFLSQGTAVRDMLYPSRIVVGVQSERAESIMRELYQPFDAPVMAMDLRSAELVKYASNDFLALKISYINEIANLCDLVGADVERVAEGMGADPRIGEKFLRAGIGYGGSCFPKDTKALHWLSVCHGHEIKTIKAAIEVNTEQKTLLVAKAKKRHGSLRGKRIAVLGLTFKPNTDDLRDAPSLDVVRMLADEGATMALYDPCGMPAFEKRYPEQEGSIVYAESPQAALDGADMAFILTEWDEFSQLSPSEYRRLMRDPELYDGRNLYPPESFEGTGVRYESIGRPVVEQV